MKTSPAYCLLFFLSMFTASLSAQYIQVNDTYTAQQLVEDVLINSSCASVSNFTVTGGNFSAGEQSYGYFSGAGTSFPFQEGIVLSTGRAVKTQGPNSSLLDDDGSTPWAGDNDLEQALGINNSVNATLLEFDFVPLGSKISFDYMLSSEEYHDNAPCRYSDGFAFLLKEANSPTAPYINLAVVPGTSIPVKVTSVHPLITGGNGCDAQNEAYFGAFNNNGHPTNFNGQTKVLKARANVTPGVLYHIKLVIADEGNYRYDSAIFIGGGSFDALTDLGADRTVALGNPLCDNGRLPLDATTPGALGYQWFMDNNVLPGETAPTYEISSPGTYQVQVQLTPTCFSKGEITVEYAALPTASGHTLLQCDDNNDGLTVFNLNLANTLVTNNDPGLQVTYYRTQAEADARNNAIANTAAFANTTVNQQVFAVVTNAFGCGSVSTVTLATSANSIANPDSIEECDDDDGIDDGFTVIDITRRETDILQGLPAGLQLRYFTSLAEALSTQNPIANPQNFTNTIAGGQIIYARISGGSDCYGIAQIPVTVYSFGGRLNDEEVTLCAGSTLVLDAGSGYNTYTWNTDPVQISQTITVSHPGTYSVLVTNAQGCRGIKNFTVTASGAATGADFDIADFSGSRNSVTINPAGAGNYEYSLDGSLYQDSPVFNNLPAGEYTVYIRDTNGCLPVYADTVYILDYPKYFTPNQDGLNDLWRIPFLNFRPDAVVTIFDRYGKVVKAFKGTAGGWDGTFNNRNLPSDDYWFMIALDNGRIISGHFAMIR